MPHDQSISDADYARLLTVRTRLRRFEHWSAEQASAHGLTSSQHQLLLAIRGHPEPAGPTIGQVAEYLLIKPHSAVELVDRTQRAGLLNRCRDSDDHRVVRLRLSPDGSRILAALTSAHIDELGRLAALVESMIGTLREGDPGEV